MVAMQLGLATELLVATSVRTYEDGFGLDVEVNIVCYLSIAMERWR
jgi:hypothetical protein